MDPNQAGVFDCSEMIGMFLDLDPSPQELSILILDAGLASSGSES